MGTIAHMCGDVNGEVASKLRYRGGLEPAGTGEHFAGHVGDVTVGAVVDGEVLDGSAFEDAVELG